MAKESRVRDRANRLLIAASTGNSVEPLSPELDELFVRIEDLESTRVEVAFPKLVELRPELRALEQQFEPRNFSEDEKDALWDELIDKLAPVLGPEADVDDPLLRTGTAHNIARLYLAVRVGLLDEVEYD